MHEQQLRGVDTVFQKGCDRMGHKDDVRMDKRCAVKSMKLSKQ